jgi:adenosine deaminase
MRKDSDRDGDMRRRMMTFLMLLTLPACATPRSSAGTAPGSAEARTAEAQTVDARTAEARTAETPTADARTADARTAEARTAARMAALRDDVPSLLLFLRAMPKGGDLHSHLSGTVYAETFIEWAAQDGLCADTVRRAYVRSACTAPTEVAASAVLADAGLRDMMIDALSMRNWHPSRNSGHSQFFGAFARFAAVLGGGRSGEMLATATTRAAAGRVSYLELMATTDRGVSRRVAGQVGWDPDLGRLRERMLAAGLSEAVEVSRQLLDETEARQRELLRCASATAVQPARVQPPQARPAAVQRPEARPAAGCHVTVRYLYGVARALEPETVFAQILAAFEIAHADPRVVGLNLLQPEDHPVAMRDYALHMQMIAFLRPLYPDVRVTLHAGELAPGLVPPEGMRFHIRHAVEVAGAQRIGHGVAIAFEEDATSLLERMARDNVLVEINLSSNAAILGIQGEDHPLRLYLRHGVPVALSTDDEGVLRSEMTMEYLRAVRDQDLDYVTLKRIARASLEHAFVADTTRQRLLQDHDRAVRAFEAQWGGAGERPIGPASQPPGSALRSATVHVEFAPPAPTTG